MERRVIARRVIARQEIVRSRAVLLACLVIALSGWLAACGAPYGESTSREALRGGPAGGDEAAAGTTDASDSSGRADGACSSDGNIGDGVFPELDPKIEAIRSKHRLPGLAIAYTKHNRTVFARGYGQTNRAGAKATARSVFLLASSSKPFTAIAIMQLVELGKLGLDDDVNDLLRQVPLQVRNPKHPSVPITVRALLTHTSSIVDADPYWDESFYTSGDPTLSMRDFVSGYFTRGAKNFGGGDGWLDSAPGTTIAYSNIGVGLLALIVEERSGEPFAKYCRSHIFEPLGMHDTSFAMRDQCDPSRLVEPLSAADDGKSFVLESYGGQGPLYGHPEVASGMLRSTAADLTRYVRAFANGGELEGKRILRRASLAEMERPQHPATLPSFDGRNPGDQGLIGYYANDATGTYFGHGGGQNGVGTEVYVRMEDHAGFVILANAQRGAWVDEVWSAILASVPAR
jgi:CubicO group peptidase (beta-lactamase class C family)